MLSLSTTLALNGSFEPPHPTCGCDADFGATPVIYQPPGCPTLAAAVNKDGYIHLLKADDLSTRNSEPLAHAAGGILGVPAYWPSGNMLFVTANGPGIRASIPMPVSLA